MFFIIFPAFIYKLSSFLPELGNSILTGLRSPSLSHHSLLLISPASREMPLGYLSPCHLFTQNSPNSSLPHSKSEGLDKSRQRRPVRLRCFRDSLPGTCIQSLLHNHQDVLVIPLHISQDLASELMPNAFSPLLPQTLSPCSLPWKDELHDGCDGVPGPLPPGGERSRTSEGRTRGKLESPFLSFPSLPSCTVGPGPASLNLRSQLPSGRLSVQLFPTRGSQTSHSLRPRDVYRALQPLAPRNQTVPCHFCTGGPLSFS